MKRLLACLLLSVAPCAAQSRDTVAMLFAGDVVLSNHVAAAVGEDPHYVFRRWQPGSSYDVVMVNLEQPITRADEPLDKQYTFKMDPRYVETLRFGGIGLVHAANNHIFDYGVKGILETMRVLDSAGITYVGIGADLKSARSVRIVQAKGWKIGFLGYYGEGEFAASATRPGVAPRLPSYVTDDVTDARKAVDFLVVGFHWGVELSPKPEGWQVRLAHRAIDAGADLVIGHHPHVLQGIELYKGKPIAYSLGNFIFGGNAQHSYLTGVVEVVLDGHGARTQLLPVRVNRWQPTLAEGEAARAVSELVKSRSELFPETISFTTGAP